MNVNDETARAWAALKTAARRSLGPEGFAGFLEFAAKQERINAIRARQPIEHEAPHAAR